MAGSFSRSVERLVRQEDYPYRAVSRSETLLIDAHVRAWLMGRVTRVRLLVRERLLAYFLKITGKIEESLAGRFITEVALEPATLRLTVGKEGPEPLVLLGLS
jgi:hypothetical protein